MAIIPDFLKLPGYDHMSGTALRRTDLAELRLHVRHPEGVEAGRCLSHAICNRLVAHGMLERRNGLSFATPFGIEVAVANASCTDGSEIRDRAPGRVREDRETQPGIHWNDSGVPIIISPPPGSAPSAPVPYEQWPKLFTDDQIRASMHPAPRGRQGPRTARQGPPWMPAYVAPPGLGLPPQDIEDALSCILADILRAPPPADPTPPVAPPLATVRRQHDGLMQFGAAVLKLLVASLFAGWLVLLLLVAALMAAWEFVAAWWQGRVQ